MKRGTRIPLYIYMLNSPTFILFYSIDRVKHESVVMLSIKAWGHRMSAFCKKEAELEWLNILENKTKLAQWPGRWPAHVRILGPLLNEFGMNLNLGK